MLTFPDGFEPTPEAIEWLERVNALIKPAVDRAVLEVMLYGSADLEKIVNDVTPEVFGRGEVKRNGS